MVNMTHLLKEFMSSNYFKERLCNRLSQMRTCLLGARDGACTDHMQLLPYYSIKVPVSYAHPWVTNQGIA